LWSSRLWRFACRDVTNGFQLYQSDPSGNYGGWKATAIGANSQGAQNILKQDFKDEITLEEAVKLIIKVISWSSFHTSCSAPSWLPGDECTKIVSTNAAVAGLMTATWKLRILQCFFDK